MHPVSHLAALRGRLRGLFQRTRLEHDLNDEIEFHIANETEKNIRKGHSPAEARRLAYIEFGGMERVREEHRDARGTRMLRDIPADVRYAARTLRKNADFASAVILTMMLGIGATAAVFSVAYGVLMRPLPYVDADRIVRLWSRNTSRKVEFFSVSPADFARWREGNHVFTQMGAYERQRTTTLLRGGEPQAVDVSNISPDIFALLGTQPMLGRRITDLDIAGGPAPVALLDYELWSTQFGRDSSLVGKSIVIDNRNVTVIGVMPPRFTIPGSPARIWMPFVLPSDPDHSNRSLRVLARVRPGVTMDAVKLDMKRIAEQLQQEMPESNRGWDVNMMTMPEQVVGTQWRRAVFVLEGVAAIVLLIACANAANLLLARAASRRQEIALRAAFGARRGRIVRQLLSESSVLAFAGGAGGLVLAYAGIWFLRRIGADTVPRIDEVRIDGLVLGFTALVTIASAFLFGLLPAIGASRAILTDALNGARGAAHALVGRRTRAALVVTQMALSLILLVGTGLLLQSFVQLQHVDLGFSPRDVQLSSFRLPESRYTQGAAMDAFYRELLASTRRVVGDSNAALVSSAPFAGVNSGLPFVLPDRPPQPGEPSPDADYRVISDNYFRVAGIRTVRGRDFTTSDTRGAAQVVIISEKTAQLYWPGVDPIGKQIGISAGDKMARFTIIGVVGDARYFGLEQPDVRPLIYFSMYDSPQRAMSVLAKTANASALSAGLRETVRRADPLLPVPAMESLETIVGRQFGTRRFALVLFASFAGIALFLAALGLYGVIAYMVRQRTREMGIRTALGATASTLVVDVVAGAMKLAVAGVALGLVGSWALTDFIASLLYGVSPTDVLTFGGVALLLALTAALASLIPALRATKVDPMLALRAD